MLIDSQICVTKYQFLIQRDVLLSHSSGGVEFSLTWSV